MELALSIEGDAEDGITIGDDGARRGLLADGVLSILETGRFGAGAAGRVWCCREVVGVEATDGTDSSGVEAGVGVPAGRGIRSAAGLRKVKVALISSNSMWPEGDK